jgi:glycosyl transferase family 2
MSTASEGDSTSASFSGERRFELTVVVPAFNEADRLPEGMHRFDAAVAEGAIDVEETELLLVDDGSWDETAATATKLLAPFPHHRVISLPVNRGKGAAVRAGVAAARGRSIAYMDADMAIDPRAVPLLLEGLRDHDIAVGSRALRDSMVETTYVTRSLMGHVFNRLVTAGTGLGLRDTQCGFKALRAPVARLLFGLVGIDRFAFDVELLLRAHRLGLAITEAPVQWKHVVGSTVQPLTDSVTMVTDAFRSRLGLVPVPEVPAVIVKGPTDDPSAVRADVTSLLASSADGRAGCLIVGDGDASGRDRSSGRRGGSSAAGRGADITVLFPLLSPEQVAECWTELRAELDPLSVSRRMLTFGDLQAKGPLAGRISSPD